VALSVLSSLQPLTGVTSKRGSIAFVARKDASTVIVLKHEIHYGYGDMTPADQA